MESNSATAQDTSVIKFQVMVINTKELKNLLADEDFDGITLQVSQAIGNMTDFTTPDEHKLKLIAYKHFSSKKKQEQITDPGFFVNNKGTEIYKDVIVRGDGVVSHFGNLKLTRADMKEDIDTNEYPYLIISPEHGTGEYENYIVCTANYTDSLNSPAPTASLSRGVPSGKSIGLQPLKPSPPA